MSFISPGQTVSITVQSIETPDDVPTVHKVYAVTADGNYNDITSQVGVNPSPSLVDATSGAYRLAFTVPDDAAHGDRYIGWLKFLYNTEPDYIAGETDCVDLNPHGLTAGQQAQLAEIKAKIDLLRIDMETVPIDSDVIAGDRICVYQGQDRVDATDSPVRVVDPGGTQLPSDGTPLVFRAVHRKAGGDSFDAAGVVAVEGADKVAIIQVPGSLHASLDRGDYSYFIFQVVDPGDLIDLDITGDLQLLLGPGLYAG